LTGRRFFAKLIGMSTVQEIESAIEVLPRQDFLCLVDRLRGRHADAWDRQIEEDAKAGHLDALWEEARCEIAEGKTRSRDALAR